MNLFRPDEKEKLYRDVLARVDSDPEIREIPESARCVFVAIETVRAIRALGYRAILQAGTAGWPRIRKDQDDGKAMTHFSYVWSPDEMPSQKAVALGLLPELHAWAAIPRTNEIVDLTTGWWPEQAKKLAGYDWPGDLPPLFFWGKGTELPTGAYYVPAREAVAHVLGALRGLYGERGVRNLT